VDKQQLTQPNYLVFRYGLLAVIVDKFSTTEISSAQVSALIVRLALALLP
jgi:hypothetical protein